MKLPLALVALATLLPLSARAQSPAADSVRALDAGWARAYATHDTTFASRLFADDLTVTVASGRIKTKADELRDVAPAEGLRVHYFRTVGVDVRLEADSAVVTGIAEWEFEHGGRVSAVRRAYTATYARGGPLGWRMVALQLRAAPAP
jgi:ketosteroid isomerase-like protein